MVSTWKAHVPPFKQTRNTHSLTHYTQDAFSRMAEPQHISNKKTCPIGLSLRDYEWDDNQIEKVPRLEMLHCKKCQKMTITDFYFSKEVDCRFNILHNITILLLF